MQPPQAYSGASALPTAELQRRYAYPFLSAEIPGERPVSSSGSWCAIDTENRSKSAVSPRSTEQCLEVLHAVPVPSKGVQLQATATEIEATATPAYRSQIGNRQPRKDRLSFTMEQLRELEKSFADKKYLCFSERQELADKIGVSEAQVKTWYQNRRTKWKRNYKLCDHVTA